MNLGAEAAEETVRLVMNGVERTVRITGRASAQTARILMTALRQRSASRGAQQLSGMLEKEKELVLFDVFGTDIVSFASRAREYGIPFTVLRDGTSNSAPAWVLVRERDAVRAQRILQEKRREEPEKTRGAGGKKEQTERMRDRILRLEQTAKARTARGTKTKEERGQ